MKRYGTLALIIILSAMPVLAQESTPAPAGDATSATTATAAPAAAPAPETAAAPAGDVDRSKLTADMQGFMTKIDELRARRAARESETSSRVLPPGEPIDSGKWHKEQGHRRVFGWPSSGRRHHRRKKASVDSASAAPATTEVKEEAKPEEKKEEPKADDKGEKKDEKKDK